MPKLVRITTMPISLLVLLKGQMRFMKENGWEVTMISSDGKEVSQLMDQEGCPHISVRLTRKITPVRDLISLIKLIRILKKIKPDIVHTHTPKAGLIGMWAAKLAGVPVRLHTIAGLPWVETKGILRRLLKVVEKITAFATTKIYPNSFVQKQFLITQNIAPKKLKVIGQGSSNGINCKYFSLNEDIERQALALRNQDGLSTNDWVWIFVGRIVKDKGIEELLDAFAAFHAKFPSDKLWIIGEEEPNLDPLSKEHQQILHQHSAIHCWGYQQDIRPYLAAAKVLVFPSYREGFPNVPLQAGAMGCALLLSDINGCNEIVENDINGLLVPPKNKIILLQKMYFLREHPQKVTAFAEVIQSKIQKLFDQETIWSLLLQEYYSFLNKKGNEKSLHSYH